MFDSTSTSLRHWSPVACALFLLPPVPWSNVSCVYACREFRSIDAVVIGFDVSASNSLEINVRISRACMPVCSSSDIDLARSGASVENSTVFGSLSLLCCVERHMQLSLVLALSASHLVGVQLYPASSLGEQGSAAQHQDGGAAGLTPAYTLP